MGTHPLWILSLSSLSPRTNIRQLIKMLAITKGHINAKHYSDSSFWSSIMSPLYQHCERKEGKAKPGTWVIRNSFSGFISKFSIKGEDIFYGHFECEIKFNSGIRNCVNFSKVLSLCLCIFPNQILKII